MTLSGGFLLYLGLMGAAAGAVSLLKPLRFLGIRTRKRGLAVLGLGLLAFIVGVYLPVTETRVPVVRARLDEFAPVFQFSEFHSIAVDRPKDRVYAALLAVTPEEIRFFRTLMWIRFGGSGAPERQPILDSFTSGGFQLLAEDPGREIVIGRAGDARKSQRINIAMNFRIQEIDARHCLVSTETRVYAVGRDALHGFAAYWRMIYPGSALIRRMWLRAIKLRAERAGHPGPLSTNPGPGGTWTSRAGVDACPTSALAAIPIQRAA
jgi:hypothetical protein